MRLCLASTVISCEPAHQPVPEPDPPPTPVERSSDESLADTFHTLPAVAPKYAQPQPQPVQQQQPQPQPQPQPQIKRKPKRQVRATICGHPAPPNATASELSVLCGKG